MAGHFHLTAKALWLQHVTTPTVLSKKRPIEQERPVLGLVVERDHLAPGAPERQRVHVGGEQPGAARVHPD